MTHLLESEQLKIDTKLQCLLDLGYIIVKHLMPGQWMCAWCVLTPYLKQGQ